MAYSPRRRIRLATVAGELTTCPHPVGPTRLRRLDTSNGCQDHTLLPSASAPVVLRARLIAHSENCPAMPSRPTLLRPPHPIPTFVTIREAPLVARRDGEMKPLIWVT